MKFLLPVFIEILSVSPEDVFIVTFNSAFGSIFPFTVNLPILKIGYLKRTAPFARANA